MVLSVSIHITLQCYTGIDTTQIGLAVYTVYSITDYWC